MSPVLVVFAAIYHWYPKITGRMLDDTLGKLHFWITFLGTYAIYYPMHYLGFEGMPRRYYSNGDTAFMPESAQDLNTAITMPAIVVAFAQLFFIWNMIISYFRAVKECRTQPLGRHDARMADAGYTAGSRQLGQRPAAGVPLGV